MMVHYNLSDFQDVNEFLSKLALKSGSLKKGGIPDINKASQRVLTDWTSGKITYYTEPPERTDEIISVELVTQMKAAFDIDGLLENEEEQLNSLKHNPIRGISLPASEPMQAAMDLDNADPNEDGNDDDENESDDESMDEDKAEGEEEEDESNVKKEPKKVRVPVFS